MAALTSPPNRRGITLAELWLQRDGVAAPHALGLRAKEGPRGRIEEMHSLLVNSCPGSEFRGNISSSWDTQMGARKPLSGKSILILEDEPLVALDTTET